LPKRPSRFVRQEQVDFDAFLANRFGMHYDTQISTRFGGGAPFDTVAPHGPVFRVS
jgi:hypothetical protein